MTSEMIEYGAAAMREKRRELINQPLDRIWPDLMRAAIEAMREPNAEMILAAFDGPTYASASEYEIANGWRLMIDTALADPLPVVDRLTDDGFGSREIDE